MTYIMVSGGFDPIHMGHVNLFKNASKHGQVVVALNSDDWLIRKKGFFFQSWRERMGIISSLKFVDTVVPVEDSDGTVCAALREHKPDLFGNGGDRKSDNTPEVGLCNDLGIQTVWNLGEPSTDMLHSSHILRQRKVDREWGSYEVIGSGEWYQVKRLIINPGGKTSIQYHRDRHEHIFAENFKVWIKPLQIHQIVNESPDTPLELIEIQLGDVKENDIERLSPADVTSVKHRIGKFVK